MSKQFNRLMQKGVGERGGGGGGGVCFALVFVKYLRSSISCLSELTTAFWSKDTLKTRFQIKEKQNYWDMRTAF